MRARRGLALSLRALLAHRARVALVVGSVAAGVGSVLLTSGLGSAARAEVLGGLEAMGSNLLVVRPVEVKRQAWRRSIRGVVTTLLPEDAEAIAALPEVELAAPGADAAARVKAEGASMLTTVRGTTPAFRRVRRFTVRSGRFLDEDDERLAARVAVLGSRVALALFPHADPVGRSLRIRGVPFEVVGTLAAKGEVAGSDEDNQVLVPARTFLRRVRNVRWLGAVYVSLRDEAASRDRSGLRAPGATPWAPGRGEAAIRTLLRERHRPSREGEDDFAIQNQAKIVSVRKETADSLALVTTGFAGLALLVGGTGILALMLLTVRERTSEIGLRLAVGARPVDILLQFLGEAAALAAGGWILGVCVGWAGAWLAASATSWRVSAGAGALVWSLGVTLGTGLGFGAVPAWAASRVRPIEALQTR